MENKVKALVEGALAELKEQLDLGRSEVLSRYLECMARFHRYSWCNVMLISKQCPDATQVAGFRRWQELGRYVRKGEKGIGILAPMVRRKEVENGEQQGEAFVSGFRVVYVFDLAQTEGDSLPELSRPKGDACMAIEQLEAVIRDAGITLGYESLPAGTDGYAIPGSIGIAEGLPSAKRFLALAHELAHHWLAHHERRELTRKVKETEAEACAFVVAKAFGVDAVAATSEYIQLYNGDSKLLGESLGRIQQVSRQIIDAMQAEPNLQMQSNVACAA